MRVSLGRGVTTAVGVAGLLFLLAPMAVMAIASLDPGRFFQFPPKEISLHWYRVLLEDSTWLAAIGFSLKVAGLTTLFATLIGTIAGIAIARVASGPRKLLYLACAIPLAVPPITLAIALYGIFLRLHLIGETSSFVFANTVLTAPLVALLVAAAALGIDPRLEFASLSCGASLWRTLVRITGPLVAPTALAAGALAFLLTLDEVVISSFLVGPGTTPVAVKLFGEVREGTSVLTSAVATLLILTSMVVLGTLLIGRTVLSSLRR